MLLVILFIFIFRTTCHFSPRLLFRITYFLLSLPLLHLGYTPSPFYAFLFFSHILSLVLPQSFILPATHLQSFLSFLFLTYFLNLFTYIFPASIFSTIFLSVIFSTFSSCNISGILFFLHFFIICVHPHK